MTKYNKLLFNKMNFFLHLQLYKFCIQENFVQPFFSAIAFAFWNCHALIDEALHSIIII